MLLSHQFYENNPSCHYLCRCINVLFTILYVDVCKRLNYLLCYFYIFMTSSFIISKVNLLVKHFDSLVILLIRFTRADGKFDHQNTHTHVHVHFHLLCKLHPHHSFVYTRTYSAVVFTCIVWPFPRFVYLFIYCCMCVQLLSIRTVCHTLSFQKKLQKMQTFSKQEIKSNQMKSKQNPPVHRKQYVQISVIRLIAAPTIATAPKMMMLIRVTIQWKSLWLVIQFVKDVHARHCHRHRCNHSLPAPLLLPLSPLLQAQEAHLNAICQHPALTAPNPN